MKAIILKDHFNEGSYSINLCVSVFCVFAECILASIDAVNIWDAVVHVNDINGYQGVIVERMSVVERFYVSEEVGGVFAVLFVTVEGDKGVQDTVKIICRPGGWAVD